MVNPYQPPQTRRRERPFFDRLRRGLSLAKAEYFKGLKQEGFQGRDHLVSWIALVAMALMGMLICAWVVAVVLIEILAVLGN